MTTRNRTPSEAKWVLNELAAVSGEMTRIEQALERLEARRTKLARTQAALQRVAALVDPAATHPSGRHTQQLSVNTHERWKGRGNLRNCIRQALTEAFPSGVSTSALTDHVAQFFGIELPTAAERKRFMDNSVRSALTKMRRAGEVEPLHDFRGMPSYSGIWRLRQAETSLESLCAELKPEEQAWR